MATQLGAVYDRVAVCLQAAKRARPAKHSEVAGIRDTLDAIKPAFLARVLRACNCTENVRSLPSDATVHPSVSRRFALAAVQHADSFRRIGPMRCGGSMLLLKVTPHKVEAASPPQT
jgi:hypothetical protein